MKIILFIFLCFPLAAFNQNLTGTWEGSGGGTTYIRLVVKHKGDSLFGYTYDEGSGYCQATFLGRYSKSKKRLIGRGNEMIKHTPNHVLVDYDLIYSKEPEGEFLRENMGEAGFLQRLFGSDSRQYLKKVSKKAVIPNFNSRAQVPKATPVIRPPVKKAPVVAKPVPPKKTVPVKPTVKQPSSPKPIVVKPVPVTVKKNPVIVDSISKGSLPPAIVKTAPVALIKRKDERSSRLVETIYTSADNIKMMVYDNGEVDGDTVTVFFDNAVILDRYRISEKAKELTLPVARNGQQHLIELFANNLGTIPPNTALIIITAGNRRYELRASYDLQTNARIIIQYKE